MSGKDYRVWDGSKYLDSKEVVIYSGEIFANWRDFEDGEPIKNAIIEYTTGITDLRGIKIFEGDILKVKTEWKKAKNLVDINSDGIYKGETYWSVEYKIYNCEMGYFAFGIDRRFKKLLTQSRIWNVDAMLAGNIHENHELLEDAE